MCNFRPTKIKVDILTAITAEDCENHVLAALPTGAGKTIPELLVSIVSEGEQISILLIIIIII